MRAVVVPSSYVPQDMMFLWMLVNHEQPTLVGELRLSQLVADCATFQYREDWWHFPLSEDLPLVTGQEFTAGERSSAPGAIDDHANANTKRFEVDDVLHFGFPGIDELIQVTSDAHIGIGCAIAPGCIQGNIGQLFLLSGIKRLVQ